MIVIMRSGAEHGQVERIERRLLEEGYELRKVEVGGKTVFVAAIEGVTGGDLVGRIRSEEGVEDVIQNDILFKEVVRQKDSGATTIDIDGIRIGGGGVAIIAGPCTVESYDQIMTIAASVAASGAALLRGGAYKPSTSPYSFRGLGRQGLELLRAAADTNGLRVVTEVMDVRKVAEVSEFADVLQIGSRNMQNYDLLREVGRGDRPVLLKRGLSARIKEWLLAAEHIAHEGNERIILCERGIRSFDTSTRNVLDLAAVPLVKEQTHLPVVVDPSHATGRRNLVLPMSLAAVAAGADGLMIETHSNPAESIKDAQQTISLNEFNDLCTKVKEVAQAVGRSILTGAAVYGR